MTEPLYHTDAYLKEFDAVVTAVEGNAVALDRTGFYPGGGGQPNDLGVISSDYGASVTGGNMEPLKGRMDFEFETMRQEFVKEIEVKINVEVAAARPIKVKILPRAEAFQIPDLIRTKINLLPEGIAEVRTVEIVGLDLQADGGTHVANTSEVGQIKVVDYKSKGKINKRIEIEVT